MKKWIAFAICVLLMLTLCLPAMAASEEPVIIQQPKNATYPKYSVATYTVKVTGTNLTATWYLEWEGKTYNISKRSGGMAPWEVYAGETYGDIREDANTFTFFFGGIEPELDGGQIWCVIEDGHYDVVSDRAVIRVSGNVDPPVILEFPTSMTVFRGDYVQLQCKAAAPGDSQLTWTWYETETGNIQDIRAICDGPQYSDTWQVSSEWIGTRYYVCMVESSEGGTAYSNVVAVTVLDWDPEPEYPPETTVPPTTAPPETTVQPTTAPPETTVPPTTAPPETTVPPTTAPPETTVPPTTAPPETTVPPTTTPPETTVPPTTAPPETTVPPTTAPPETTVPPTTALPETTVPPTTAVQGTVPNHAPAPTETAPTPVEAEELPWWAFVVIGAAAALAGVGVAVLLVIKKNT